MARQLKAAARAVSRQGTWTVKRHPIPTTKLLEFGPTWMGWPQDHAFLAKLQLTGAICKVVPPAGTPFSAIDALEVKLYELGARVVRILPALPEEKLVVSKEGDRTDVLPEPARSLREVAIARVHALANATDTNALLALVNEAMDYGENAI